jgi:hypothetical protein
MCFESSASSFPAHAATVVAAGVVRAAIRPPCRLLALWSVPGTWSRRHTAARGGRRQNMPLLPTNEPVTAAAALSHRRRYRSCWHRNIPLLGTHLWAKSATSMAQLNWTEQSTHLWAELNWWPLMEQQIFEHYKPSILNTKFHQKFYSSTELNRAPICQLISNTTNHQFRTQIFIKNCTEVALNIRSH